MKTGKKIQKFFQMVSLWKTLYWNFKLLPFSVAIKFPILVGKRVTLDGVHRWNGKSGLKFRDESALTRFSIMLGVTKYTLISPKACHTYIRMSENAMIVLGCRIQFCPGTSVVLMHGGCLEIGNGFRANHGTAIYCYHSVVFGDNVRFGWHNQVYDTDFHVIYNSNKHSIANPYGSVSLGNNVWVTNHCTIAKNSHLPAYSMLSSGSLCNKDFRDVQTIGNLFVGSPCKCIRDGFFRIYHKDWEAMLLDYFEKHPEEASLDATTLNVDLSKDSELFQL